MGWIALGIVAGLGAAGVAILGRVRLSAVDTTLATVLRSVVMTGGLLVVTGATGSWKTLADGAGGIDRRAWMCVLLAGACGAASWLAYFAALKQGPAGPVAALDRLSLPLVFLLGVGILGEKPGGPGWAGPVLATSGILMIVWDATHSAAA